MKRVIAYGLLGILFSGTTEAKISLSSIKSAIGNFTQNSTVQKIANSQTFQVVKQVAVTAVIPKIKEKISNMKSAVTNKNAEAITTLNSTQSGLVSNANVLAQSNDTQVTSAVNSANASAGQIIAQLQSLGTSLSLSSSTSQMNSQSTTINLNNIKSAITSFVSNIQPYLENIKAQLAALQSKSASLDANQQIALSNYTTYANQLVNLVQASAYASTISTYIDQVSSQLQANNITVDNLKIWISELSNYGTLFQQALNNGGIYLDSKMATLISGSDLVTTMTASGIAVQSTAQTAIQPSSTEVSTAGTTTTQPAVESTATTTATTATKKTTIRRRR